MPSSLLSDPRLAKPQTYFAAACVASRMHSKKAAEALAAYGGHGAQISGCVRDHFPETTKNDLRFWAREVTRYLDLAHANRPKRVRVSTMVKLGREVATRDGSGFYGPQPIRA